MLACLAASPTLSSCPWVALACLILPDAPLQCTEVAYFMAL